jgi:SNF2 family DNA or RNA helicase
MAQTVETKLRAGDYLYPATVTYTDSGKIDFSFRYNRQLMAEIKSMAGARWCGNDDPPRKIWSVEDNQRNRFQLSYMQGENPYEWFERPIQQFEYTRPLMKHQREMTDIVLTNHFQLLAAEMGCGKTLSAIEAIEKSNYDDWYWVGPRSAIAAVKREFVKWDCKVLPQLFTYEGLVRHIKAWKPGQHVPHGIVLDEASRVKTASTQRSQAAKWLSELIWATYGYDAYIVLMSGTPAPKSPVDWWHLAEVCCPGFLREGTPWAFENRMAFLEKAANATGQTFNKRISWKDDENKCAHCGRGEDFEAHDMHKALIFSLEHHPYEKSVNEVSLLFDRLAGLVTVKHKAECLPELPEKIFRVIRCKPSPSVLRASTAIARGARNAITAMTLLRELSDGFQYSERKDGMRVCPHCEGKGEMPEWFDPTDEERVFSGTEFMSDDLVNSLEKRIVECTFCCGDKEIPNMIRDERRVKCPKDEVLKDLLEENEEHNNGRMVVFAGFTGSINRCCEVAMQEGWTVVRVDGRGWSMFDSEGQPIVDIDPLDLWADTANRRKVCFVAHPASGGMGLTLTEACMVVFYSNGFSPEDRSQACDRIHRIGLDVNKGAVIVDIIHLPSDERVLTVLNENRRIELMSMNSVMQSFADLSKAEDYDY